MQNQNENTNGDMPKQVPCEELPTSVPASGDVITRMIAEQIIQTHELAAKFGNRAMRPHLPPEEVAVYAYIALKNSQTFATLVQLLDRRRVNGALIPGRLNRK